MFPSSWCVGRSVIARIFGGSPISEVKTFSLVATTRYIYYHTILSKQRTTRNLESCPLDIEIMTLPHPF